MDIGISLDKLIDKILLLSNDKPVDGNLQIANLFLEKLKDQSNEIKLKFIQIHVVPRNSLFVEYIIDLLGLQGIFTDSEIIILKNMVQEMIQLVL